MRNGGRSFLPRRMPPAILPAMVRKPRIAIIGPGRLGRALAIALARSGHRIAEIVSGSSAGSQRSGRELARVVRARVVSSPSAELVWVCVPDREISGAARDLAQRADWEGKIVFHSSGALTSDELQVLRRRGAAVASVHPLMTFVRGSTPSLESVPFGAEGDPAALRAARSIVRALGGYMVAVPKSKKAAYHTWGAFTSPLLVGLLVSAEGVARAAGFSKAEARKAMLPIVRQTIANYHRLGPAGAFSGPMVRGDVETVRKHLRVLRKARAAREVYVALARAALHHLPAGNRKALGKQLRA